MSKQRKSTRSVAEMIAKLGLNPEEVAAQAQEILREDRQDPHSGSSTGKDVSSLHLVSTSYLARALTTKFQEALGWSPYISSDKIRTLTLAGLLANYADAGRERIKLDLAEVEKIVEATRYVPDPAEISPLILRVSVLEARPDKVTSLDGKVLRKQAGIDYRLDPEDPLFLGGFEGIWSVSESNADRLVRNGGLLMASCKGYVAPGCVRKVIGWEAVQGSSRRYFHTEPAPAEVQNLIGEGIWIDVPGGSESGILVDEI